MKNRHGIAVLDAPETRGRTTVVRRPHKPEAAGSIPAPATTAALPPQRPIERHYQISCGWIGCKFPGCYPYGDRHWCGEHLDVVIVREHRGAVPAYLSTMEVSA